MRSKSLLNLYTEQWLMRRLQDHGCGMLDEGVTTAEERKQRVAQAIQEHGLEHVVLGRGKDGKPLNYGEAFARLYGEVAL